MKLSEGDRLILVMLSELYKHHKIAGEIDPDFVLKTVYNRDDWALAWKYSGLFESEKLLPDVQETCDILDMYRLLQSSFKKLSPAEQVRVQKEASPFDDYVEYQGFDGNNDPHLHIVSVLVEDLGRYSEIKNPDLNSHSVATLRHYRDMLRRFKPMTDPYPRDGLTCHQIIEVLRG